MTLRIIETLILTAWLLFAYSVCYFLSAGRWPWQRKSGGAP